jgi:sugar phosphate isomerase/epimerase
MKKLHIHPRISLNPISSMRWTLEEDLAFCAEAGIEIINVPFFKFHDRAAEGIEAIKRSSVRGVSLSTGGGSLIESGAQTLETLKPGIDAAVALGCPSLYGVSGPSGYRMTTDEAYDRLVQCLGPAVDYAHSKGVQYAIEHTSISTRSHGFIHNLADAIDLSRDAGIGITLELQNCWYERHLEKMFRENVDRFAIVQVSDFLVGEDVRMNRRVLGDGSMPLEWMLQTLLDAGYEGYFDVETVGPAIEKEGYALAITRSLEWLTERFDAWGVR